MEAEIHTDTVTFFFLPLKSVPKLAEHCRTTLLIEKKKNLIARQQNLISEVTHTARTRCNSKAQILEETSALKSSNLEDCVLCAVFDSRIATASFSGESAEVGFQDRHESHLGSASMRRASMEWGLSSGWSLNIMNFHHTGREARCS